MNAIPYILVALILFFLYLCESKRIKSNISISTAQRLSFVILLVFIGLRGHIYSDFISYYPFYDDLPNIYNLRSSFLTEHRFEPGFVLYSSLIKTIIPNYFGWVFINTLLDLLVLNFVFKRYTTSRIIPFFFYIGFYGLMIEFNLYRNIKAIDLFLLSLPFLEQRKFLPYILLNLIGTTFHSSSFVYIPLYFIINKEIPNIIKWGGIIIANIIFLFKINVIGDILNSLSIIQSMTFWDKLSGHIENSDASQIFSIGYFERTFSILTFTLLYQKLVNQNKSNIIFYNCFWLYYVTFLCFYEVQVLTERIPRLFVFSYWILYPNIIYLKYNARKLIYILSTVLVFLKVYTGNTAPSAKYENILWSEDNYEERKHIQLLYFEQIK